jgi:hypothetical protein
MPDDQITQMASDPDFGKMPLSEQRKALAAHDPGFGQMGDDDITKFVSAHQGQTPESQAPNAAAQAHQQMQRAIPTKAAADAASYPGARPNLSPFTQQGQKQAQIGENYNNYMQQSGSMAGQMAGGMATGGLFPAIKGAGVLKNILPFLGRTAASGAGMGAGTLAGGGSPQEAKSAAESGVVAQPIAEGISAALPWMAKGLKSAAVSQYGRALAPTTKINKAITQEIAPEMIQRGVRGSLEGMEQQAGQKISELNPQLNTAYDVASQAPIKTQTDTLGVRWASDGANKVSVPRSVPDEAIEQYARPKLAEQAQIRGNMPWNTIQGAGTKVVQDLENLKQTYMPQGIPAQPQAVNAIEGIQNIVKQYGSDVSPTSLRRLRQIFEDPVAQRGAYAGADISTNYTLNAQKQAADSIRGILNKNPDIGALNKEISFWLDVQRVTSQSALRRTGQEGGLLKTLWPLGAAVAGGGAGFAAHGAEAGIGAAAATMLSAQVAKAVRSPAWRTISAVTKDRLADALSRGDVTATSALLSKVGLATATAPPQSLQGGLPWQRQQQSGPQPQ